MSAPGTRSTEPARSWSGAVHIAALWALAVAGPIYDVLRQNAEFFVAYRTTPGDILSFVAALSIGFPVAIWLLIRVIGALSAALGRAAFTVVIAALVALLAAQAIQPLSAPSALHVGMAAGFGAIAAAAYAWPAVRSFATWLLPAIVAFPLVFLFDSNIRPFVSPPHEDERIAIEPGPTTPVVFVVFDQLPLTSLLAPDGAIDATSYPGFAELARHATWFRNATTVGELTTWALPPLVSGEFARAGRLPSVAGYPRNIFTTLRRAYAMEVFEPITTLCPDAICRPTANTRRASLRSMLADSGVVLAHRVVPATLTDRLPSVTENWRGFVEAERFQRRWAGAREDDRREVLTEFLNAISGTDPEATLYFLHALLPHEPYEFLPSGQAHPYRRLPGISFGRWPADRFPVVQAYARHLLQVSFVDRFVGRLIERLRAEGLFDKALIVVTADHGVAFVPERGLKALSRATAASIVPVPLFIKRPFQQTGEVSDRNVQGVDVLPAIADALGVALPFETEGRSPFGAAPPPDEKVVIAAGGKSRLTFESGPLPVQEVVNARVRWFGDGPAPYWTTRLDPRPELRGRSIDTLDLDDDPALRISFDNAEDIAQVDPAGDEIPVVLSGRVRGAIGRQSRLVLAIAVNGRIATTTRTYVDLPGTGDGTFVALVPPDAYREGYNEIRIYIVRRENGIDRLIEAYRTDPP